MQVTMPPPLELEDVALVVALDELELEVDDVVPDVDELDAVEVELELDGLPDDDVLPELFELDVVSLPPSPSPAPPPPSPPLSPQA
jgi:hypothetical protein